MPQLLALLLNSLQTRIWVYQGAWERINEHVIAKFPNLLHFLNSWVIYKEEKGIPLVGPKHTPPTC
jgi:hypothetical protein